MNRTIAFLLFFFTLTAYSQVKFEKGYVVNNDNKKIECLIKNIGWNSIPEEIDFKITDTSVVQKGSINNLISFAIYNSNYYYKKYTFSIDENLKSESEKIKNITSFLKVLVEGEASLLEYNSDIFLYEDKSNKVKQLLYKKYINNDNKFYEDFSFKKEIYNNLNCKNIKINVRLLNYHRKDLINYFIKYNECQKAEYKTYTSKNDKAKFIFNLFGGIGFYNYKTFFDNSMVLHYPSPSGPDNTITYNIEKKIACGNISAYNIGFETELLLPINKYKWSIFTSPNYNFQNGSKVQKIDFSPGTYFDLDFKINKINYFEIPIGLRHYFYLNNNSKINLGGAYNFIYVLGNSNLLEIKNNDGITAEFDSKKIESVNYVSIIAGYTYKNKYSISINYYPSKEFNQNSFNIKAENSFALLLKYSIF